MKIIKHCTNHHVAHLYEHLFFIHVDSALREKGLYPIIDYSIDAHTDNGEIVFDIDVYRDINIEKYVRRASEEFLGIEELIDIAIHQIEAESARLLTINDRRALEMSLEKLNETQWNIDTVVQVPEGIIINTERIPLYTLLIAASFEDVPTELKPLYRLIAGVTIDAAISDIADTIGGFVTSEAFTTIKQKKMIGEVRLHEEVSHSEITKLIDETQRELNTSGAYKRLVADLTDVKTMMHAPSIERTFEDTGVLMDDQKWKSLSTYENLKVVTSQLSLEISTI